MRRVHLAIGLVISMGLVGACGGVDEEVPDAAAPVIDATPVPDFDAPIPDAAAPDAFVCHAPLFGQIGGACDNDADCGFMGFCLDETEGGDGPAFPATGMCTRGCTSDAQCGDSGSCSDPIGGGGVLPGGGPGRLCFRDCCPGNVCTDGFLCQSALFGFLDLGIDVCLPADGSAVDGDACESFADCNVNSVCQSNPFNAPGGVCITFGCTLGDDSTCAPGGDGTCLNLGGTFACLDTCSVESDCRDGEGYTCVGFGGSDFCWYPTGEVGDACTVPTVLADCGPPPWECLTGGGFPGGYCGADGCDPTDGSTCPQDAICYDADPGTLDGTEFCARRCNPAADPSDCREGEGYACIDLGLGGGETGCIYDPG